MGIGNIKNVEHWDNLVIWDFVVWHELKSDPSNASIWL